MAMASPGVEMASSQTFNCVPRDRCRHERCVRDKDSTTNNVRTVQTDKNPNGFTRDHLNNNSCSISREDNNGKTRESQINSTSHHSLPSSPLGSDANQFGCNPGQPENPSRNEILGASSLVQIWEARLQQPNSGQSQTLGDSRTTSGLSPTENPNSCSESLNGEYANESEGIQPVDEGNDKEAVDCGSQEREGVRVLDIIRKLSNEPEMAHDNSSNGNNDSGGGASNKEVQTTEQRSFPQVACSPRIRGRQAYEDLLMHMVRDRQKELAWLLDRNAVSKFTYRGRLQSALRIRCLARCIAIQDRHRSKSAASDVNRSPRGSGLMSLRDKIKTDSENSRVPNSNSTVEARSSSGHHLEASRLKVCLTEDLTPNKAPQDTAEKNFLQETTEKSSLRERRGANCALEVAKKAENSRVSNANSAVEARSSSSLASSQVNEGTLRSKCSTKDAINHKAGEKCRLPLQETAEKNVLKEMSEKSNSQEEPETNCALEVAKKAVSCETAENRTVSKKPEQKVTQQQATKEKSKPQENAEKITSKESADESISTRISEKVNLWNSEVKSNRRKTVEKTGSKNAEEKEKTEGKVVPQITEKKAMLQEVERRILNVETAERSITSRETVESVTLRETTDSRRSGTEAKRCNEAEIERNKTEEANFAEAKNNTQEVAQTTCLRKLVREARDGREEEETTRHVSRERTLDKKCVQDEKEVSSREAEDKINEKQESKEKGENRESSLTTACLPDEPMESFNSSDESGIAENEVVDDDEDEEEEEDEEYADYDPESSYDWFNDISRPRSYWEDLRKQWYLEVMSTDSQKEDIRKLIERRTVSDFLSSNLREKIDKLMISRVTSRLDRESKPGGKELAIAKHWKIQCSESYKESKEEKQDESETEQEQDKTNQEGTETENQCHEAASDGFSQSSARSTMMSWSFRDQEAGDDQDHITSPSLPAPNSPSDRSRRSSFPTDQDSSSSEMQMICDLKSQMEQLQREVLELRSSVKSCINMQLHFQKSIDREDSRPAANQRGDATNPLKRKCCVCFEMPVDSLLYRCGHMCTCLKCAHELQWNSRKCPICMAPIVDVVRAFLDS